MPSLADLEYDYLATKGATGATLDDRRSQVYVPNQFAYFSGLSGLTPAQQYSLNDHKYKYFGGTSGMSLADAAGAFWAVPPPSGNALFPAVTLFPGAAVFPKN